MAYQVLARKWRPQNFSSLVGQEPIVTALRNALREGRIAQAYLFSGIRGVGKTTAARVLAKALNCERGPAADPCNECSPCVEITRGSDIDVIEVDAATYSKVEQVRELTESLRYGPARDRYKVVVLDEIHRLSRQAFDALLKIVEEPPRHLVFIFATTEIDAVPATILSRCQEFNFRRVPSHDLAAYLRTITDAESITASDTALRLIARAGEGSVRDSVALLDQLATFGSGSIADEDTVRLLGGLDTALFQTLLTGILAGDSQAVAAAVRRIEEEGWDPRHVYGQFLAFSRDALHLAMGGAPEQIDLPGEEARALAATAKASGYENLLRLLTQLLASEPNVRRSDTGALAVEIAWLRAAELPKLVRVEEILAGTYQPGAAAPAAARPAVASRPAPAPASPAPQARSAPPPEAAPRASAPPASEAPSTRPAPRPEPSAPAPAPAASAMPSTSTGRASDPVTAFKEEIAKRKPNLAGFLDALDKILFEDGKVTLLVPGGDAYLRSRLDANRSILEEAAKVIWGQATRLEIRESQGTPPAAVEAVKPARPTEVEPAVQAVLEIFQGSRVEAVEEHGNYTEE
jgi:DNA polymerase-3 subunit gamma/tau